MGLTDVGVEDCLVLVRLNQYLAALQRSATRSCGDGQNLQRVDNHRMSVLISRGELALMLLRNNMRDLRLGRRRWDYEQEST